jgi:hypothetical protein
MDRMSQLAAVRAAIDAEDPEGLLALGSPADEYSHEASIIAGKIHELSQRQGSPATAEQISEVVAEVWIEYFGPFEPTGLEKRKPLFLAVGRRLAGQA